MFLINSIVSTLPFTIIIFFLLDISITEKNISLLFSLKFWGVSVFSFLFVPFSKKISIKNIITTSVIIRLTAYLYFFIDHSFHGAMILVILNSLSASLFTTASKIHIQNSSYNISLSLSRRFTLNNIGVSITPMFLAVSKFEHIIIISIALSIFLLLLTLMLNNSENYLNKGKVQKEKINLDKKLLSLIFVSCLLFSLFYLTYEKNIPILLERRNDKGFYATLVTINTIMIIALQIKTFSLMTRIVGLYNAFFLSYILCSLSYVLFFLSNDRYSFIIIFVIGITYLEMFFSTGIDSIIIEKDGLFSKYYFIAFNIFIAIGISLSSWILTLEKYILLIILILLMILGWLVKNIKKAPKYEN